MLNRRNYHDYQNCGENGSPLGVVLNLSVFKLKFVKDAHQQSFNGTLISETNLLKSTTELDLNSCVSLSN
jgi:hypothetical protein